MNIKETNEHTNAWPMNSSCITSNALSVFLRNRLKFMNYILTDLFVLSWSRIMS